MLPSAFLARASTARARPGSTGPRRVVPPGHSRYACARRPTLMGVGLAEWVAPPFRPRQSGRAARKPAARAGSAAGVARQSVVAHLGVSAPAHLRRVAPSRTTRTAPRWAASGRSTSAKALRCPARAREPATPARPSWVAIGAASRRPARARRFPVLRGRSARRASARAAPGRPRFVRAPACRAATSRPSSPALSAVARGGRGIRRALARAVPLSPAVGRALAASPAPAASQAPVASQAQVASQAPAARLAWAESRAGAG